MKTNPRHRNDIRHRRWARRVLLGSAYVIAALCLAYAARQVWTVEGLLPWPDAALGTLVEDGLADGPGTLGYDVAIADLAEAEHGDSGPPLAPEERTRLAAAAYEMHGTALVKLAWRYRLCHTPTPLRGDSLGEIRLEQ